MMNLAALPPGHRIGERYEIECALGRGRSSVVYRATDAQTRSPVALKVLDPILARDDVATARFAREARILRELAHPNVIKLYDFLQNGEWLVLVMEYFESTDCKSWLRKHGPLPMDDFARVARSLVSAVGECHRARVLHRDLKPQNILVSASLDIKVIDFGVGMIGALSGLTRTGTALGTPEYMAPEAFRSSRMDPRSDIYSMGAVFYELLSGHPPYVGNSMATIMDLQLRALVEPLSVTRPEVPRWLDHLILKCLRIDSGDRYQNCYDIERDLEAHHAAPSARADGSEPTPCRRCSKEMLAALPFCHHCGALRAIVFERGKHHLLFQGCDDLAAFVSFLTTTFGALDGAARLKKPPATLARGISRQTAVELAHQISAVPCDLRIADRLLTQLELSLVYLAVAAAALVPLFWFAATASLTTRIALLAGAEMTVFLAYRRRTRGVLRLTPGGAASVTDPALLRLTRNLLEIRTARLRTVVAHIIGSHIAIQCVTRRLPPATSRPMERAVTDAVAAARRLDGYETYLNSTTRSGLLERLEVIAAQRRRSTAGDLDGESSRNAAQTAGRRDLQHYEAIEELHSGLSLALFRLQEVLRRIETSLPSGKPPDDLLRELTDVDEEFRAEEPRR